MNGTSNVWIVEESALPFLNNLAKIFSFTKKKRSYISREKLELALLTCESEQPSGNHPAMSTQPLSYILKFVLLYCVVYILLFYFIHLISLLVVKCYAVYFNGYTSCYAEILNWQQWHVMVSKEGPSGIWDLGSRISHAWHKMKGSTGSQWLNEKWVQANAFWVTLTNMWAKYEHYTNTYVHALSRACVAAVIQAAGLCLGPWGTETLKAQHTHFD